MVRKTLPPDVVTMDELLTASDVARTLGLSTGTLANWRSIGMGPAFVKVGGRVRYRASSVNTWLVDQERKAV